MKRRWWWFIGLALALLAAWVFVWNWSGRLPYRFMESANLLLVQVDPKAPTTCVLTYTVTQPIGIVSAEAESALRGDGRSEGPMAIGLYGSSSSWVRSWSKAADPSDQVQVCDYDPNRLVPISTSGGPSRPPPVSKGVTGFVLIVRKATLLDRARAWFYRLRFDSQPR